MGETSKAHRRRQETGWFSEYAPPHLSGIDIGCQHDPLNHTFRRWDVIFGDGDATLMEGVPDGIFQTVYASHVLEHLEDPRTALVNWCRILAPGGHLIVLVPHRDLYEKRESPPSRWNHEHKWFFLPERAGDLPPGVLCLRELIEQALPEGEIVRYDVLDEGWTPTPEDVHSVGEYTIEAIVRKT